MSAVARPRLELAVQGNCHARPKGPKVAFQFRIWTFTGAGKGIKRDFQPPARTKRLPQRRFKLRALLTVHFPGPLTLPLMPILQGAQHSARHRRIASAAPIAN